VARILLALILAWRVLELAWPRRKPQPPSLERDPPTLPAAGSASTGDGTTGGPTSNHATGSAATNPGTGMAVAFLLAALLCVATPEVAHASEIPDEKLLESLRDRLLEPPSCLPTCADLSRLRIEATEEQLRMRLELHAAREVAIPLPGQAGQWLPEEILLNGKPVSDILRQAHGANPARLLWIVIPEGIHQLTLRGDLPTQALLRLDLPMPPRYVETESAAWEIERIQPTGNEDGMLQLRRRVQQPPAETDSEREIASEPTLERPRLPTTLEVTRILSLGPVWEMETQVRRVAPAEGPIAVELPLIEGESPTSEQVRMVDGRIKVNLENDEPMIQWRSTLEIREMLHLVASKASFGHEIWQLRASPLWHVALEGIAPIRISDDAGQYQPEWRPWPGDEAHLRITRLAGVDGPTITLERSEMAVTPGERSTDVTLTLTLHAGQGGEQHIRLPEGARLRASRISGREVPLRQEENQVTVPITPGRQAIRLDWRQPDGIAFRTATPRVDLEISGVNTTLRLDMPADRWILLTRGPTMGPAVLYWGTLGIALLLAIALGRIPWLPLKSRHWFLLGLGLSTVGAVPAMILSAWFLLFGWRAQHPQLQTRLLFNLRQLFLMAWTLAAGIALGEIFRHGLLGYPEMQIQGNLSHAGLLRWFADRSEPQLPEAVVYSLPIMAYRVLMLLWSLWLAAALLGWIRWAWGCYSTSGLWRAASPKTPASPSTPHKPEKEGEIPHDNK
ncbi:MAG: hypothetical protein HQL86_07140, partial [Magnetococcales bacterium]|nr:hypothetical protein [Magnetococcales bacterium]